MGRNIPVDTSFSLSVTSCSYFRLYHRGSIPAQYSVCVFVVTECRFHGNIYNNGDVFSPDDCSRCTCEVYRHSVFDLGALAGLCRHLLMFFFGFQAGRVECDVITCPSVSCDETSVHSGSCCPVCPTSTHNMPYSLYTYILLFYFNVYHGRDAIIPFNEGILFFRM